MNKVVHNSRVDSRKWRIKNERKKPSTMTYKSPTDGADKEEPRKES